MCAMHCDLLLSRYSVRLLCCDEAKLCKRCHDVAVHEPSHSLSGLLGGTHCVSFCKGLSTKCQLACSTLEMATPVWGKLTSNAGIKFLNAAQLGQDCSCHVDQGGHSGIHAQLHMLVETDDIWPGTFPALATALRLLRH